MNDWKEFSGQTPVGFGGVAKPELASDGYWYSRVDGRTFRRRGEMGAGAVGDTDGEATEISKTEADDAAEGSWVSPNASLVFPDGTSLPPEVFTEPGGAGNGVLGDASGAQIRYARFVRNGIPELYRYAGAAQFEKNTKVDPTYQCAPGFSRDASGNCIPIATGGCPTGFHKDASGACVKDAGCAADHIPDGKGNCIPDPNAPGASFWSKIPTWAKWTGGAILGAGVVFGGYELVKPKGAAPLHKKIHRAMR